MTPTRETTLLIPRVAPSFNELKGMHWAEYRKLAQTWRDEIALAYRQEGSPEFDEPVEIAYVRSYWNRPLDWDNLGASAKPVIDALLPPRDSDGTMMDVDVLYVLVKKLEGSMVLRRITNGTNILLFVVLILPPILCSSIPRASKQSSNSCAQYIPRLDLLRLGCSLDLVHDSEIGEERGNFTHFLTNVVSGDFSTGNKPLLP